jgi:hypothetical protein
MKTTLLAFALVSLFLLPTSNAQDHAPTVAQCQADEDWWSGQAEEAGGFPATTANLSIDDLLLRAGEMEKCVSVDRQRGQRYAGTAGEIFSQITVRLGQYIHETGQDAAYLAWEKKKQQAAAPK